MQNKKVFLLALFLFLSLAAIFLYEPELTLSKNEKKEPSPISLSNLKIKLEKQLYWEGAIEAKQAFLRKESLLLKTIDANLIKQEKTIYLKAHEGLWSLNDQILYLKDHVVITDGLSQFEAEELICELKTGICRSDTPITWRHGQIFASSPRLEEKMTSLKEAFGIDDEFSD